MMPAWLTPRLRLTLSTLGIAQIINWGVLYYTLALIGPHIVRETGWSDEFVYSGFGVATLVTGLLAPVSGAGIDRFGGLPVMVAGTLIGALGTALLAISHTPALYLVAWAIMGAGMSACLYDSAFAAIARFAGSATRKSISLVTLIAGFASTVIWPLTSALLTLFEWRGVCLIDAALIACVSAPMLIISLRGTNNPAPLPTISADHDVGSLPNIQGQLLAEKHFSGAMVLFAIVLTSLGFVANALSVHVITLFQSLGIDAASAILAGSLIGPAQVGARILELAFGRRLSAMGLGMVPVILMPLAFSIPLLLTSTSSVAILFGVVYGAANGLATIARGVVPYALFGPNGYGRRLGLITAPTLLVKATSPAIFAAIMAGFGPLSALVFVLCISLFATLAMMGLIWLVRRYS